MARDKSELERGIESLGKALTGVTGRLLGPKAIGRETLPDETAISPEADEAVTRASEDLGRLLNAAGEALKAHPLDPAGALREARARTDEPVVAEEGWSPLAAGLVNLGGGLAKVAEGVLDVVAPRKSKAGEGDSEGPEAGESGAAGEAHGAAGEAHGAAGEAHGAAGERPVEESRAADLEDAGREEGWDAADAGGIDEVFGGPAETAEEVPPARPRRGPGAS